MARPRKYVNRHILKELCQAQLSNDEISRVLRVSWDTLDRRYAEAIKAWRQLGPASARRELFVMAMGPPSKGKLSALIFYLKNYGGMADRVDNSPHRPIDTGDLPIPTEYRNAQSGASGKPN